jgi:RHS repeat-associated protein
MFVRGLFVSALLVLAQPVAVFAQTTCEDQGYRAGATPPRPVFSTIAASCKELVGTIGKPGQEYGGYLKTYKNFSNGVATKLDYTCFIYHNGTGINPYTQIGSAECESSPGVWGEGICAPDNSCNCSATSSCDCESFGGGSNEASSTQGASNRNASDNSVGNPVSIAQGYKSETAMDWTSPKDARFQISRIYKSGGFGAFEYSREGFGLGWSGDWAHKVLEVPSATTDHIVYAPGAERYRFDTLGANIATTRKDQPYTLTTPGTGNPNTYLFKDGKGTTYTFLDEASSGISNLTEVTWSDGYTMTLAYDAVTGNLSAIEDNRSQRAEYTWVNNIDPNGDFYVISEIEIDANYDGMTFAPDVRVEYENTYNTQWPSGLIFDSAKTVDIAGDITLQHLVYDYGTDYLETDVPRLVGVSDSRLDGNGNTYDYATFTYDTDSFDQSVGAYRADKTEYFNAANRFLITPIPGTAPEGNFRVTNSLGRETDYAFDWIEGARRATQIDGIATGTCLATTKSLGYTPNTDAPLGYVYERTEKNGAVTEFLRDTRGLVTKKTEDANGTETRVTDYTWHATYRLPLTRTTAEMTETFTYDADGLLATYTQSDLLTAEPNRTWTYAFTALASGLKVMTTLDGPGLASNGVIDETTFSYNADGTLASTTDPNGLVTNFSNYDAYGNARRIVLPDGVAWELTFDAMGRLTRSVYNADASSDHSMDFTYDIAGQMTSHTDGFGRTWTYTYDQARRLVEVENNINQTMNFSHDAMGNVTKTEYKSSSGAQTFFEDSSFDELGRLMTMLGAVNQSTDYRYDEEDNLIKITQAPNGVTDQSYDALNRMYEHVGHGGQTTLLDHNDADQVTDYTDPRSNTTGFTYNGFGDVIEEDSPDRGTITNTYDTRGLVTSMTDGRGTVTNYSYDDGGRIKTKTFPAHSYEDQLFIWDYTSGGSQGEGKIRKMDSGTYVTNSGATVPMGRIRRTYSNGGYLSTDERYMQGERYLVEYQYDSHGRLTSILTPGDLLITYTYNNQNRLRKIATQRQVIDPGTGQFPPAETVVNNVQYRPFGPVKSLDYGDGGDWEATYDKSYRRITATDQVGTTQLRDASYGWTDRDFLATVTDNLTSGNSEAFGYNNRNLLNSATGLYGDLDYSYDNVGNRSTIITDDGSGAVTDTYNYPSTSNRLSNVANVSGTRSFTHDGAGNVLTDSSGGSTHTYDYDASGRMKSYSIGSTLQAEYHYNTLGQQIIRYRATTDQTIHVVHDADGNRLAEYGYDPATDTSTLLREYIWLDGEAVGVVEEDVLYFVRTDHIGRPIFATDGTGSKVWEATYLPFGGVHTIGTIVPLNIDLRFPGQWYQSESGLYQNWMRGYDPTTGRYLQADPLGLIDGPSVYGYALQNPQSYIDFFGEETTVSISYHPDGWYGHASVMTDEQIYDPSGANCLCQYDEMDRGPYPPGSGETYERNPLTDNAFRRHQSSGGWVVHNYRFATTPEQERLINDRIRNRGGGGFFGCARSVSNVLDGIGPFRNLGTTGLPSRLERRLRRIPQPGR